MFKIKIDPQTKEKQYITDFKGKTLLRTPTLNKGSAFSREERKLFELSGCLPYAVETIDRQVERVYREYLEFTTPLEKNNFLNTLHDTNEVLYYRLLLEHIAEMMPIIYTPTEGLSIEKYSHEFRRPRGLYVTYPDIDNIDSILEERVNEGIDLILVTDSEEILGIGDQGVGGIGIAVSKLVVYSLCAGVDPTRTLPIVLDVGTNRKSFLDDPLYVGWREPRVRGTEYDVFIDKFVTAVKKKFPGLFLHWEDFGRSNARRILEKYQDTMCTFNDDMQGTGAIATAGLLASSKGLGVNMRDHRIVIFGAGTAGCGVADRIADFMVKDGLSLEEARKQIWCVDKPGLLLSDTPDLTGAQKAYVRDPKEVEGWTRDSSGKIGLEEVVSKVHPTVLLGTSTRPGAFTEAIVKDMAAHTERPIIFPLSNPTKLNEAKPEDVIKWTDGKALIATGSPFDDVSFQGRSIRIGECNNAYVFPGLGLGAVVSKATRVSEGMIQAAVEAMAETCPVYKDSYSPLMPPLEGVRSVSKKVAIAVATQAMEEGLATNKPESGFETAINEAMWKPQYIPISKA
jgi:malate dehydrogenase (oxaloacetate-decarboxylating)